MDRVLRRDSLADAEYDHFWHSIKDCSVKRFALILILFASVSGCNLLASLPDGKKDPSVPVAPVDPVDKEYSEQEYWNQLAKSVKADVFTNSDDICSTVDRLAKTGELKDLSRIDDLRKTRIDPIREEDRAAIISALTGG